MSQAKDILSDYQTGVLENSAKMVLLFHLIDESVRRRDKILVFRQVLCPMYLALNVKSTIKQLISRLAFHFS